MRSVTLLLLALLPSGALAQTAGGVRVEANKAVSPASPTLQRDVSDAVSPLTIAAVAELEDGVEPRTWQWIVVHHSATEAGTVEAIDAAHRQRRDSQGRPWRGIGYHFVIGNGRGIPDGQIEPTFRWRQQLSGAHAGSLPHNSAGIGVCLIGNFQTELPTDAQQAALRGLVRRLATTYHITGPNVIGHRDVRATACPGDMFPANLLTLPAGAPPSAENRRPAAPAPDLPAKESL